MQRPTHSSVEIGFGVIADARRALWLPEVSALVIADTHFGHAWVERARGQLLPLSDGDVGLRVLFELLKEYRPRELVIAGDVVHAARSIQGVGEPLLQLCRSCSDNEVELVLVQGNHDRGLTEMVARLGLRVKVTSERHLGRFRIVHGDAPLAGVEGEDWVVLGHEHPCVTLRGAGNRSARCPCFLVGQGILVLPAFSSRAAGCTVESGRFLGPVAASRSFDCAVVCVGTRLLKLPLPLPAGA